MKKYPAKFSALSKESAAMFERNDCTVKATALVTGWNYRDAHRFVKELGRRDRCGFHTSIIANALERNGWGITSKYVSKPNGGQYTMTTIGRVLPKGRYMVQVDGHVAALVDGEVLDWTAGRRHRVIKTWKIEGNNPPPWAEEAPLFDEPAAPPAPSAMPRSQMMLF